MKVLFLDCDGVLNTRPGSLDGDKLNLLREIVSDTGCRVVISSDWRLHPHMHARLAMALADVGIRIHGETPCCDEQVLAWGLVERARRSTEITLWLAAHPEVTCYAILDDMAYADDGSGRFVQTDSSVGLTKEKAEQLREILTMPAN